MLCRGLAFRITEDWRCDIKVHTGTRFGARRRTYCGATNFIYPLEPAAAQTAGPLIAPKEHLRLTGMMFVRTCVRAYVTLENIVHSISRGRIDTKR